MGESKLAVVYIGNAKKCKRTGKISGERYVFLQDEFGMPSPTYIDRKDLDALLEERGPGCATHEPNRLFMSFIEWTISIRDGCKRNRL